MCHLHHRSPEQLMSTTTTELVWERDDDDNNKQTHVQTNARQNRMPSFLFSSSDQTHPTTTEPLRNRCQNPKQTKRHSNAIYHASRTLVRTRKVCSLGQRIQTIRWIDWIDLFALCVSLDSKTLEKRRLHWSASKRTSLLVGWMQWLLLSAAVASAHLA